jgi:hypothetical protein
MTELSSSDANVWQNVTAKLDGVAQSLADQVAAERNGTLVDRRIQLRTWITENCEELTQRSNERYLSDEQPLSDEGQAEVIEFFGCFVRRGDAIRAAFLFEDPAWIDDVLDDGVVFWAVEPVGYLDVVDRLDEFKLFREDLDIYALA